MKIYLAADHAGFEMKEQVKKWLLEHNYSVIDCGAKEYSQEDNYPDYMHACAEQYSKDTGIDTKMIVFGGSGTGEAIVVNRYTGIRSIVYNGQKNEVIRLGRAHNNANCLSIGTWFVDFDMIAQAIELFLRTPFEEGRHTERVQNIERKL